MLLAIAASLSWADWRYNPDEFITCLGKAWLLFAGAWGAMQVLKLFKLKPSTQWQHRAITCCILFLLFAPDAPWWGFLLVGAVTETLQRVLRSPAGPWANPAALGALLTTLVFHNWGLIPTWWGASFAPRWYLVPEGLSIASLLLVPVAGWVAWKYKKLWTAASLVIACAMAYIVAFGFSPVYLVFEGTLLFFVLVMAVEPKTSPVLKKEQILYGAFIGVATVVLLKIHFIEAYLGALVAGNVLYNGKRWWTMRQLRQRAPKRGVKATVSAPSSAT